MRIFVHAAMDAEIMLEGMRGIMFNSKQGAPFPSMVVVF